MFPNLEAEMARKTLLQSDIAQALHINLSTVNAKLNVPGRLKLSEAQSIRNMLFPELSLDYLFETRSSDAH